MDFVNRMKQKIVEEFESEVPPELPEGNGSDVESLKAEITELRHHVNANYQVYVKRLEKRKTKIKELESLVQSLVQENERLSSTIEELDGESTTKLHLFSGTECLILARFTFRHQAAICGISGASRATRRLSKPRTGQNQTHAPKC